MIVTLDSGIYISAMEFAGVPKDALIHAITADQILICTEIEVEVVQVMIDKFGHLREDIEPRLSDYVKDAKRITVTGELSGVCRDPNDDFILELAGTGNAQLIVTGDKDLLSLVSYGEIEIVIPRQYLDRAGDELRRS